jgi:hypothetical protein
MKANQLKSIRLWVAEPERGYRFWLGKHCITVAWIGLFLAIAVPPHGLGINLCWFHDATRSLSCGIRGLFAESFQNHPMGLLILGLFIFTALQSVTPRIIRARLLEQMRAHAAVVNGSYLAFVGAFLLFGIVRALVHSFATLLH